MIKIRAPRHQEQFKIIITTQKNLVSFVSSWQNVLMLNSYKKQHKMLLNILKKGIPFAIGIGLLNILMDSADGAVISHKKFITEYVIKSLVTGLLFGTIMTLYNRYKENKRA